MSDLRGQAEKDTVVVHAVQMDPRLFQTRLNLDEVVNRLGDSASVGAALAVFPECALTGYIMHSREEALSASETIPGSATEILAAECRRLNMYAVVGMLEVEGDRCYNSAVLVGPEGLVGKHRKAHLPRVGVDRWVDHGDIPFRVYDTEIARIGLLICYDMSFPESIRCLALDGMELLAHPTNSPTGTWGPPGSRSEPEKTDHRARGERVYVVSADRCGVERDIEFVGGSRISAPSGRILSRVSAPVPETITANVHPTRARSKYVSLPHIGLEVDYFADRRPDLYGKLTEQSERIGPPAAVTANKNAASVTA